MNNDYDRYARQRQEEILSGKMKSHSMVEKPMMQSMLFDLTGKKVLMLGCGTGDESILLKEFGASDITGVDLSEVSVNIANECYPDCTFKVMDMHKLDFEDETFDFVYSSLTVHYSDKPEEVYKEVNRVLKKDGKLLFSIGHPLRWASKVVEHEGITYRIFGCSYDKEVDEVYGNYNTMTKIEDKFPSGEVLQFYTVAPSQTFKQLRRCGFDVLDFTESQCIEEAKESALNYYIKYKEMPNFMAFLARKNG